ncbi:hypothetical protein ACJMK2_033311 [Sinanodonta woodiana]|uniref:B30.2/SPRY domain-containing protein n=1 Tax=Sinanodonta woodiana TaxID=1069815 RepID=A0ABD3WN04_SINWO
MADNAGAEASNEAERHIEPMAVQEYGGETAAGQTVGQTDSGGTGDANTTSATSETPGAQKIVPITYADSQLASVDSQDSQTGDSLLCYCGKARNLGAVEIQCSVCSNWFHAECTSCYIGTCIPFMCNYVYSCRRCSPSGLESFNKKQASFSQICYTAMANLTYQAKARGETRTMFSKDAEIIPYIDKQWENLTTMARRIKLTWHTTIQKTLTKENDLFVCSEEVSGDVHFGLANPDLYSVSPGYECLLKSSGGGQVPAGGFGDNVPKPRGPKRKSNFDLEKVPSQKQRKGESLTTTKLAPHGYPLEHPFNKDGYRYILAEPDPHAPNRQAFDESTEWAGKPIPGYLYRTFLGSEVLLALHDRATQLKISDDRLSVSGEKGYSMVRATHGVRRGSWYYEVHIDEMIQDSATRIGWSQALGNLQAPCGYEKFSYSWRSKKGTCFHQSKGKHFSDEGYGEGDVIGFYIYLPDPDDPSKLLPPTYKDRPLVKFKSHLYYEEKDYVAETEKNLKISTGSKMIVFKNGKSQGVAFSDVFEGLYYPAISLYKNAKVTVNFGPEFKCQPEGLTDYKPMSAAASQLMIECALADAIYHVENEGKLPEF